MSNILFVGKNTSVSKTIIDLIGQIDMQYVFVKDNLESVLCSDNEDVDICILNLSDWDRGNMTILKSIASKFSQHTQLLVIDNYNDHQLINKILESGATAYIEQKKVLLEIENTIRQLAVRA